MKIRIQVIVEQGDDQHIQLAEEVACFSRENLLPATLGLQLAEGKDILAEIQRVIATQQVAAFIKEARPCSHCQKLRGLKDAKTLVMRTVFGKLTLPNPRFYSCPCREQPTKSVAPLAHHLLERTTPELKYLQSKWASLVSYGMTVNLLEEVLPLEVNTMTIRRHTQKVAERLESDMEKQHDPHLFGIPMMWDQMPEPASPLTVGIDGGYIHARDGDNRKAGWFEAIVGKSMPNEGDTKRFAFVHKQEEKPQRHLIETLKAQGLSMRQSITFLSDGGDTVRNLQGLIVPYAEHILDWFHITMRITTLKQMSKGFVSLPELKDMVSKLDKIKWYLWHGNAFEALQKIFWLHEDVAWMEPKNTPHPKRFARLVKSLSELHTYIENNHAFIPNYGERHRYGECISTVFVESTVNEVISRRIVKKQQMRWTPKGAHTLLQVRVQTLNDDLRGKFCHWYPGMAETGTLVEGQLNSNHISC
jgi:hypothetical protein